MMAAVLIDFHRPHGASLLLISIMHIFARRGLLAAFLYRLFIDVGGMMPRAVPL